MSDKKKKMNSSKIVTLEKFEKIDGKLENAETQLETMHRKAELSLAKVVNSLNDKTDKTDKTDKANDTDEELDRALIDEDTAEFKAKLLQNKQI